MPQEPKPQYKHHTQFDPDFLPNDPINRQAAEERGLTYDSHEEVYKDEDGCPTRDEFGQPL